MKSIKLLHLLTIALMFIQVSDAMERRRDIKPENNPNAPVVLEIDGDDEVVIVSAAPRATNEDEEDEVLIVQAQAPQVIDLADENNNSNQRIEKCLRCLTTDNVLTLVCQDSICRECCKNAPICIEIIEGWGFHACPNCKYEIVCNYCRKENKDLVENLGMLLCPACTQQFGFKNMNLFFNQE